MQPITEEARLRDRLRYLVGVFAIAIILVVVQVFAFSQSRVAVGSTVQSKQQHHENFVGLWLIDQPMHALYEATLYDFKANGDLEALETVVLGYAEDDYVTGTVARPLFQPCDYSPCAAEVTCRFGSRWHSLSEHMLVILGNCEDGERREIIIDVKLTTYGDFSVDIVSVGRETGWEHLDWAWMWRKCVSRSECIWATS